MKHHKNNNKFQIFFLNNKNQINSYKRLLNNKNQVFQQLMILIKNQILKNFPNINSKSIFIRLIINNKIKFS